MDPNIYWVFFKYDSVHEAPGAVCFTKQIYQSKRDRKRLVNLKTTYYKIGIFLYKQNGLVFHFLTLHCKKEVKCCSHNCLIYFTSGCV